VERIRISRGELGRWGESFDVMMFNVGDVEHSRLVIESQIVRPLETWIVVNGEQPVSISIENANNIVDVIGNKYNTRTQIDTDSTSILKGDFSKKITIPVKDLNFSFPHVRHVNFVLTYVQRNKTRVNKLTIPTSFRAPLTNETITPQC